MPSTDPKSEDYECPTCFNNAFPCGCMKPEGFQKYVPTQQELHLLAGAVTEDSIRLAISLHERKLVITPFPHLQIVLGNSLLSCQDYGVEEAIGFPKMGLIGRWEVIPQPFTDKKLIVQCSLEGSDQQVLENLIAVPYSELMRIWDEKFKPNRVGSNRGSGEGLIPTARTVQELVHDLHARAGAREYPIQEMDGIQ
jgi:hypothetical protein